eukprot:sb/3469336/
MKISTRGIIVLQAVVLGTNATPPSCRPLPPPVRPNPFRPTPVTAIVWILVGRMFRRPTRIMSIAVRALSVYHIMSVDWDAIYEKLPTGKGQKAERKEMFNMFDPNVLGSCLTPILSPLGNGILSLAECDKAMRDVICIDELFDAKPAIMRAWQIAKNCTKSKRSDGHGDDYIEFREFKFFLCALRQYFEYFVAFSRVDADDDRRINLEEFTAAQELMEKWVGPIEDAEAEFVL